VKRSAQTLAVVLCSGLLLVSPAARASALDDLMNAAGQGMPNVPEPSGPSRADDDSDDRDNRRNRQEEEQERQEQLRQQRWEEQRQQQAEQARQEALRRQREEAERQAELQRQAERERQERAARERREREERERQEALRRAREAQERLERQRHQAAVAARAQWTADDQKNEAAFDGLLSPPGTPDNDPNVVDLTDATHLTPVLLRDGGPRVSLRIKPPPLPQPELILDPRREAPEPPPPPPQWELDLKGKLTDLGFAYASMYLKSKVEGLASIPELAKDAVDLRKRLTEHCTSYLDNLFRTAREAADPRANYAVLSDRTWNQFQTASANFDEDARRGVQNNVATTSSGALPEGTAAEVGIGMGQAQLQDTQELKKWGDEHASDAP
jgi:hypothetical protein